MLDVLIVGGGPHALTLATLLAHPDVRYPQPSTDILDGIQLSQPKTRCGWSRGKRRPATAEESMEEAAPGPAPTPPLHFRVVGSYGEWAALWGSQFSALNIPHLRSHTLVHTDPLNKKALQDFMVKHGRTGELHCLPEHVYILDENAYFNDNRLAKRDKRRLSTSAGMRKNLYFSLPATRLSVDFFQDQVRRYGLDSVLIRGTVDRIIPVTSGQSAALEEPGDHKEALSFRVLLQDGNIIEARRVVMATGPTRAQMANIPAWVSAITESYPEDRLQHTVQLMHQQAHSWQQEAGTLLQEAGTLQQEEGSQERQEGKKNQEAGTQEQKSRPNSPASPLVCHTGERMLVIGGGLTSAHIISIALQRGASHVTWVMRKHLQLKQFDVGDVESLIGRYSHVEHGIQMDGRAYLRQFYNERSLTRRLAMIRQARKGGAVTPEAYAQLLPYIQNGQLAVKPYCQVLWRRLEVSEAKWCYRNQAWSISLSCGKHWTGDRIWLATGCKLDVKQDPLLADVIKEFPIQVLDGWPCLSDSLQWAPGCPLYLMGQYSALQIGPHAVNLAGGQASSMRIAKDILSWHRGVREGQRAERTRTEEYIQQMHGLMWL